MGDCCSKTIFSCESTIKRHNAYCKISNKSTLITHSINEKQRYQVSHLSFDEFESLFHDFKSKLLKKTLKTPQKPENSLMKFSCFYDVFSHHFDMKSADLNRFYRTFDGICGDLLMEFHYSGDSICSMSPALKHFRNLKLKSREIVNDERILHYLNMIKEDLMDENNEIAKLIRDLSNVFYEKLEKFVKFGKLSAKNLQNLEKNEFLTLKNWVFHVIKNLLILPLKEIIMFLYDRVLAIIGQNLMSSTLEELVYSLSESIVFQRKYGFYETFQDILFFENHENRKNLRENCFLLKNFEDLSNENYEISHEFKGNSEEYKELICILMSFSMRRTSAEKVKILYEIHSKIASLLQKMNPDKEDLELKEKINADNLLPLLIFLIHKAKDCNLHQEIMFCESFARENLEDDYLFCIFKSALEYVTITV